MSLLGTDYQSFILPVHTIVDHTEHNVVILINVVIIGCVFVYLDNIYKELFLQTIKGHSIYNDILTIASEHKALPHCTQWILNYDVSKNSLR